jgi:formate-dependent nitrite reductase membrane component NrfD
VNRDPVAVRRPEKETRPKVFYKGAHQATLDPLAARRPEGDTFIWSEQVTTGQKVGSDYPRGWSNSSAAALLSYDIGHETPWDWRVSLYTWTKAIAAGAYLPPLILALMGLLEWRSVLFTWIAPLVAAVFLAATGGLLIWDLTHPGRFYMIFTRPHTKSWLVRGAFIIAGYGAVLGAHLLAGFLSSDELRHLVAVAGLPLSVLTAVYTAYLFAQSKARDLWQNPLLPPHMLVQMLLAGSAALLMFSEAINSSAVEALEWMLAGTALGHLLMVLGELTLGHSTAHAHIAVWEMTRGGFAPFFWAGIALVAAALAAPLAGIWIAPMALAGLLCHEHAYVQAAQAVPLA